MYKLLQPKENNFCLCIAYLCHVQKAPMHTEEKTMPGNNKKKKKNEESVLYTDQK